MTASFSSDAGLVLVPGSLEFVKIDGSIISSYATEELHPVLGIAAGDLQTAAAWLPSEEKLIRLSSSQVSVFPLSAAKLPGPIVALKIASPNSVDLWTKAQASAVQRFRLSLSSGALSPLETVTGIASNIAVINGSLLSADSGNLRIQSPGGTVRSLPFPFSDLHFNRHPIIGSISFPRPPSGNGCFALMPPMCLFPNFRPLRLSPRR
jgi:hypothetical protein